MELPLTPRRMVVSSGAAGGAGGGRGRPTAAQGVIAVRPELCFRHTDWQPHAGRAGAGEAERK